MATHFLKKDELKRPWVLIDCAHKPLGRVATRIAAMLRGKDKPTYTPHTDTGAFVVAINVRDVQLTGRKWSQKQYWRHSGYPGGIHARTAEAQRERRPEEILRHAVKGMLPKHFLAQAILKKLKIYPGAEHPHAAQRPIISEG